MSNTRETIFHHVCFKNFYFFTPFELIDSLAQLSQSMYRKVRSEKTVPRKRNGHKVRTFNTRQLHSIFDQTTQIPFWNLFQKQTNQL